MAIDDPARGLAVGSIAGANAAQATALNSIALPVICAIEGDSRADYCSWGTASTGYSSSWRGFALWVQTLTNQRIQFPGALNTAVSGNTSTQVLARMPASVAAAVAAGASAMWVIIGINDRIGNFTFAQTMSNVNAMAAMVRAAGLQFFLYVDTTQGSTNFPTQGMSQAQRDIQKWTRYAYRQMHNPRNGIFILDPSPAFDDPLSTLNFNLDTMVADGTHDQIAGSYQRAQAALPYVNRLWQGVPFNAITSNAEQYTATNDPYGCLTANPMVDSNTGTINASAPNASGQVATGWSFGATTQGAPLTAALSKVTKADGTVWQQAAISGQVTASTLSNYPLGMAQMWFYQTISLASAPIGSKVQVSSQIEWDAGNANVSSIWVGSEAAITGGSVRNYSGYRGSTVAQAMVMPQGPQSLVIANEPLIVPPTTTVHIMRIGIEVEVNNANVAMTFRMRGAGARIVP